MEKDNVNSLSSHEHHESVDRVSTHNGEDHIASEARGGDLADMPKGYYTHWRFIGTIAAVSFMAQGLYLGTCFLY